MTGLMRDVPNEREFVILNTGTCEQVRVIYLGHLLVKILSLSLSETTIKIDNSYSFTSTYGLDQCSVLKLHLIE